MIIQFEEPMTVQQLADILDDLIEEGKGDLPTWIEIDSAAVSPAYGVEIGKKSILIALRSCV